MPYFLDALASLRSHVHFFAQITIDIFDNAAIQA